MASTSSTNPADSKRNFWKALVENLSEAEGESSDDNESVRSGCSENDLVVRHEQAESNENDSASDEDICYADIGGNEDVQELKSRDGSISWSTTPLTEACDYEMQTEGKLNDNVFPQTIKDSFELFFNTGIKNLILEHTNEHGARLHNEKWKVMDTIELDAVLGILILAGLHSVVGNEIREFWDESTGMPRFRATITVNRFLYILGYMKFHNAKTKKKENVDSSLAPVAELLETFSYCCKKNYLPSTEIAIGEHLYPWRGRGTKSDPHFATLTGKCYLKFLLATDSINNYCFNIKLCSTRTEEKLESVSELCSHLFQQGKKITIEGLLVDCELAKNLLEQNTFIVGAMQKSDDSIPLRMLREAKRKFGPCLFGFYKNVAICSNNSRKKSKILLSTVHTNKQDIIRDYKSAKNSVSVLNERLKMYSVKRKTNRWPMIVFFKLLDIACNNAFIVWMLCNPNWSSGKNKKREFLKQLALGLTEGQIQLRSKIPSLPNSIKRAMQSSGCSTVQQTPENSQTGLRKRRRCHICPSSRDRKSQVACNECGLPVCREHSNVTVLCRNCLTIE